MNLSSILRETWRITWKSWPLWVVSGLMFAAMAVAMALAGVFSGLAALLSLPTLSRSLPALGKPPQLPAAGWALAGGLTWAVLVAATAAAWMLQVAAVRGAALTADHGTVTLAATLNLGRQRVVSLVKLSLTFGVLLMGLSILPPLVTILIGQVGPGTAGALGFLQLAQTGLVPFNTLVGLALFLVMMSIAVEDLTPRRAFRRTWAVLRYGWWGFLLVFALSALPGVALLLLLVPLMLTLPLAFLFEGGWLAPLLCGAGLAPVGLFILLFSSVFTTTMYTLIYRAAAQMSAAAAPATPLPT